jgi:hypothetical protein
MCVLSCSTYWLTNFSPNISNNTTYIFLQYFITYCNIPLTCLCISSTPTIGTFLGLWNLGVKPCEFISKNTPNDWYANLFDAVEIPIVKLGLLLVFGCAKFVVHLGIFDEWVSVCVWSMP